MRFRISLFIIAILAIITVIGCSETVTGIRWAENIEAGKEQAQAEEKPLMVYYSADWDELSEKFEEDVLANSEVKAAVDKIVLKETNNVLTTMEKIKMAMIISTRVKPGGNFEF